jgi:small redox-active disulfide protein 2|uniref:Thiol-disulfide isomerase and thioredoxins family protein n=1 Tax=Thiomonas intermedia (strain K12) TaxID=75379 RepID=D5WZG5_THIK1
MINIKILGTGCASCKSTQRLVEEVVAAKGVQAQVEKVEDIPSIMQYGVMRTPGVVIDGKVVHAGGVPNRAMVESWISA